MTAIWIKPLNFYGKKDWPRPRNVPAAPLSEGIVQSYIHMGGKIGVLVEVNCETDFVAKNDDFQDFAKNIAMHIAATNPVGISQEDVPAGSC